MAGNPGTARLMIAQASTYARKGDEFYPAYKDHLAFSWQALQFRAPAGGSLVVAAVAVPAASVEHLHAKLGGLYAALTISLVDTTAEWVRQETRRTAWPPVDLRPDSWLLSGVSTAAPPGRDVAVRVTLQNEDATAGRIARGTIDVSSFDPDSLTMSDIVIAPQDAAGSLQRGSIKVAIAPGRSFQRNEEPTLYYEVYGTHDKAALRTEVRVVPIRDSLLQRMRTLLGRDDGATAFNFEEKAGAADDVVGLQQSRTIGLTQLLPGAYRIIVRITEVDTGRTTTRETLLQVDEAK
jgi:hypothetical protein